MKIHKWLKKDSDYLMSFVEKVFTDHQDLKRKTLMSIKSEMNKGIFSIGNKNEPVLVATVHTSNWHPHCIYVCLAYDFNRTNKSALWLMIDFLKNEFEKPLLFLIDDRFYGLDKLLLDNGFQFIRKTEVINIHPKKSEIAPLDRGVRKVSQIKHDRILMDSLVELCKSLYTKTHLDNPVADLPSSNWKDIILDDLIEENSYIVFNENSVIAFSFVHLGDKKDGWELGWIGVKDSSDLTLLDLLLNRQLQDAVDLGVVGIEKEVDSTCPYSLHIAKSLSYNVLETWHAFIE